MQSNLQDFDQRETWNRRVRKKRNLRIWKKTWVKQRTCLWPGLRAWLSLRIRNCDRRSARRTANIEWWRTPWRARRLKVRLPKAWRSPSTVPPALHSTAQILWSWRKRWPLTRKRIRFSSSRQASLKAASLTSRISQALPPCLQRKSLLRSYSS